ncbi:MAG: TonB family protein [Rubrivivax sp.]|nr:TonB family protein [Rubrivivax sp.]
MLAAVQPRSCDLAGQGLLPGARVPWILKYEVDAAGQRLPERDRVVWSGTAATFDTSVKERLAACRFQLSTSNTAPALRHGILLVMVSAADGKDAAGASAATSTTAGAQTPAAVQPAAATGTRRPTVVNVTSCAPQVSDYPVMAIRTEMTGTTRVRFEIGTRGELLLAQVTSSSGHDLLDFTALRTLSRCQFKAGVDPDGKPMGGTTEVEYRWMLEDATLPATPKS